MFKGELNSQLQFSIKREKSRSMYDTICFIVIPNFNSDSKLFMQLVTVTICR